MAIIIIYIYEFVNFEKYHWIIETLRGSVHVPLKSILINIIFFHNFYFNYVHIHTYKTKKNKNSSREVRDSNERLKIRLLRRKVYRKNYQSLKHVNENIEKSLFFRTTQQTIL